VRYLVWKIKIFQTANCAAAQYCEFAAEWRIIMQNDMHTHQYQGISSFNSGHFHYYTGTTSPSPDTLGHVHILEGETVLSDNHVHHYKITSEPAIHSGKGHYHNYRGNTDITNSHLHMIAGSTSMVD
jgi:hypothetical protein